MIAKKSFSFHEARLTSPEYFAGRFFQGFGAGSIIPAEHLLFPPAGRISHARRYPESICLCPHRPKLSCSWKFSRYAPPTGSFSSQQ
jgi:hypothetical protein